MTAPLLSTKLYIPRRQTLSQQATLVSRPHLIEKLEAGLTGKLMLIAAPAGFGKSTLLSEWIGEMMSPPSTAVPLEPDPLEPSQPEPSTADSSLAVSSKTMLRPTFCWLSLEVSDNDPIRFWVYFIAALHSLNPDLSANTSTLLQSPEPPPLETVLTILLNDLGTWASRSATDTGVAPGIVLVLEDYHLITTPEIHQSLSFLLDHLPPTLHLVMTTRADPPLPLARLRASGQLSEIRATDLRFTAAETALFLNERMGLHLSPDDVQLLASRTEGWIAGLQLAALSMYGRNDKASFLHSFSGDHRYILNYLTEEVLNQQPKTIQEFLLHTSILARLCGPLCDAVMGIDATPASSQAVASYLNSQAMLEQLDRANLFLVPLDDLGQWYRYHRLFAEVLQHRLRQNEPETVSTLHRRASLWFAQEEQLPDAIQHALLAADFLGAAVLIEQAWPTLWDQGAIATLFNWMQTLPDSDLPDSDLLGGDSLDADLPNNALWERPSLYVSYAWGLTLTGQIEAAEACLQQVEATLQHTRAKANAPTIQSATQSTLLGRAAALRAMLAVRRGKSADAVPLAQHALALLPSDAAPRGDAYYALGLARQQQGALTEALQAYEAATQLGVASENSFITVATRYHEARILMAQGNLHKAAATYQQLLAVAAQARKQLPVIGLAHVGYGEVLYQWNDLCAAASQVDTGLALSPRRDLTYTDGPLHRFSILARVRQAVGDEDGALAAVRLAKTMAQQTGVALDLERAAALEALIRLRLGELTIAVLWATLYAQTRTAEERFSYLHEFETLVFGRVLLAQNRVADAFALLAEWIPIVEAAQRQGSMIEMYVLQVLAFRLDGQVDIATRLLVRALSLAEPEGYIRLFVDEGEPMQRSIVRCRLEIANMADAENQTKLLAYVDKLLQAFEPSQPAGREETAFAQSTTEGHKPNNESLIESLTDRQIEVLHLVAAGLSNAAIAEQLMVTVGTVKSHLKQIYGKLNVQSRTQAAAQARELGLL